jgi:hypothetical protein
LANLGIYATFLCSHHCPCLHTCRKYADNLQKALGAATSNDELGLAEDKIAACFEEEVHEARSIS